MAQQVARARVALISTTPHFDNVSMDFIFEATGSDTTLQFGTSVSPEVWLENLFTSAVTGAAAPIGAYLAHSISRGTNACQISWTDVTAHLNGSNAGSPFRTDTFTLPSADDTTDAPPALAAVCGLRANYGSAMEHGPMATMPTPDDAIDYGAPPTHTGQTRPRARMRTRIFLGPVTKLAIAATDGLLASQFYTDTQAWCAALCATINPSAANQFNLVAWSRRDAAVYQLKNYYVSEAFGTQSRRSDPTSLRVHPWVNVS